MNKEKLPKLLNTRQVAELFSMKESTIYRWHKDGTLTTIKTRNKLLFNSDDVFALLESYKVK